MKDIPLNGTLPKNMFVQITKQQLRDNAELTVDKDYDLLAESYLGFGGDHVRYVDLCNHLHDCRILLNGSEEYPIKQLYPPYHNPLSDTYPRPPQGNLQADKPKGAGSYYFNRTKEILIN